MEGGATGWVGGGDGVGKDTLFTLMVGNSIYQCHLHGIDKYCVPNHIGYPFSLLSLLHLTS